MLINEKNREQDRVKELRVKIPVSMHIKLHSLKVLAGKQIHDTVTEALELYFSDPENTRSGRGRESGDE